MNKLPNIDRVSSAKVATLQARMRENNRDVYWKEGMDYKQIDDNFGDIMSLLKQRKLRYWPQADSYIIHDFAEMIPNYHVYVISADVFHQYVIPKLR